MIRYADLRLDASTLKEMPDGSIRVLGQLTQPGIFSYRNPDGSERKEYRPPEEVFKKAALDTFAGAPVTINHPRPDARGERLVTASTWKAVSVGHLGENVREDDGHVVADIYVRDAAAVRAVRSGDLKHISCGYNVSYDPTPGVTPDGSRYDGVQRNIVGNHVALLPLGVAPRGGAECVLRLDSNGDELKFVVDEAALQVKITALETELGRARTDAADVAQVRRDLVDANIVIAELRELLKPERLDAAADARAALVASAKAEGVETAGKTSLQVKRAIIAKRTPDLASRVDAMSEDAVDAVLAVYASQPHPSLGAVLPLPREDAARTDADAPTGIPKIADLYDKHLQASRSAWKAPSKDVS